MSASVWQPGGSSIAVNAENASLVQKFIASAGQTVFTLTQFSYVVGTGSIRVYRNGVKLAASEVTELTTTTFSVPALVLGTGEVIECSAVLGSQDAVTAAAINAAASAASAAASVAAAAGVVASVDFTKTSVSTFSNKTLDSSCDLSAASGQLAGFRNKLINGDMRINQRAITIAAAANGTYGPDRWKKVDASNMTQIVESDNFVPSAVHTLSGTGITTQQITSPASGNWTLPNIPIAATYVQLEKGSIATPFETRPYGFELSLCQRYYNEVYPSGIAFSTTGFSTSMSWPVDMRVVPTAVLAGSALFRKTVDGTTTSITNTPTYSVSTKGCQFISAIAWSTPLVIGQAYDVWQQPTRLTLNAEL